MTGFLLDTNVVSELTKDAPDAGVVAFLSSQTDLWLCAVVLHELEFGVRRLPEGNRREGLRRTLAAFVTAYEGRILPLGQVESECAAELRGQAELREQAGRVPLGDALIAGTAMAHGLTVATRNVKDFSRMDIPITNPWETPTSASRFPG